MSPSDTMVVGAVQLEQNRQWAVFLQKESNEAVMVYNKPLWEQAYGT